MSLTIDSKRSSNLKPLDPHDTWSDDTAQHKAVLSSEADHVPAVHVDRIGAFPKAYVSLYAAAAMSHAHATKVDDETWFAEVRGLKGVYGEGESLEAAVNDLRDSLLPWLERKIAAGAEDLPEIDGYSLSLPRV